MFLKSSLLILTSLAIAGQATTEDQESTFSKIKETKTVIVVTKEITNEVMYMPPMMIIGNDNGSITRCPIATPDSCEVYHSGNNERIHVTATVVHGEFLYASLDTGSMLRCLWQKRNSCSEFNHVGNKIDSLAVAAGYIHAGLENGTILRCQLDTPKSCWVFADLHQRITSLTAFGSFIYAGSREGKIHRCSLSSEQNCSVFHDRIKDATSVYGIIHLNSFVYALRFSGVFRISDMNRNVNGIKQVTIYPDGYTSMAVYDRKLYSVSMSHGVYEYTPGFYDNKLVLKNENAVSISFSYGTFAMQNKYRLESQKCIWQGTCPRTVAYYDVRSRVQWEVSVKHGRLYDSQGVLLDTSDADESYSQKAAIFVMGPDGQILVSKSHKRGHTHTSSLLAGNPVSGAGLMVVKEGRIKNITACSVHYRPDQDLNDQVKESLYLKGYRMYRTDILSWYPCNYSAVLCDMDDNNVYKNN